MSKTFSTVSSVVCTGGKRPYDSEHSDSGERAPGYPWNWQVPKVAAPVSQIEKDRRYQREYWKRRKAEMKASATRVNPGSNIAASPGISNSRKAPR